MLIDKVTWYIRWRMDRVLSRVRVSKLMGLEGPSGRVAEGVVASLTSYGDRISTCHLAIRSVFDQELVPERVVLWLDSSSDGAELPPELLELRGWGLDIRRGMPDLRGHKKYFFAMREFPDSCVVTIDDDVMYDRDAIPSLVRVHEQLGGAVIARRAHRILVDEGAVLPYARWEHEWSEPVPVPRRSLMATGVGGVLYPPRFADERLLDADTAMSLCPRADDVWLKAYGAAAGFQTAVVPSGRPHPLQIPLTQSGGLSADLAAFSAANDRALAAAMGRFGLSAADFEDGGRN